MLELVGIVDRQRRHHIERAARHIEHDAGDLAQLAAERVAALFILLAHGGKILRADGVERGRRDLVERRDRKSCLAVFHRVVHELLILGDQAADTRAAGGKALGDRVDDDDVVTRPVGKLAKRLELLPAVDEFAVRLVADEEQIMLLCDIDEHLHLLVAQHNAGRVAGVRDHDGARVLVDERFDLLALSVAIPLLRAGRDRANRCTAGAGHRVVVGVERLGNENFVAVVKNALQRDLKRFAAAGGDVDLALVEVHVELVIVVLDRVDQLGDAGRGRVGQHRLLEVTDRLEKRGRSLYVGLADVEVIDVDAACLCRHRVRVELAHRRQAAFFNFAGKFHIVLLLFYYDDRRSSAGHIQYTYDICPMLVI